MAMGSYVHRAVDAQAERNGGVIRAVAAWCDGPFVLIDVEYDAYGRRALWEFDTRNGSMMCQAGWVSL